MSVMACSIMRASPRISCTYLDCRITQSPVDAASPLPVGRFWQVEHVLDRLRHRIRRDPEHDADCPVVSVLCPNCLVVEYRSDQTLNATYGGRSRWEEDDVPKVNEECGIEPVRVTGSHELVDNNCGGLETDDIGDSLEVLVVSGLRGKPKHRFDGFRLIGDCAKKAGLDFMVRPDERFELRVDPFDGGRAGALDENC